MVLGHFRQIATSIPINDTTPATIPTIAPVSNLPVPELLPLAPPESDPVPEEGLLLAVFEGVSPVEDRDELAELENVSPVDDRAKLVIFEGANPAEDRDNEPTKRIDIYNSQRHEWHRGPYRNRGVGECVFRLDSGTTAAIEN